MRRTTCDECKHDFNIKLRTKTHNYTTKETYFICPNCKHKYIVSILNPDCKRLQNQINKLRQTKNKPAQLFYENKISESEYKKQIDLIDNKIKQLKSSLKIKMDTLKQTYTN